MENKTSPLARMIWAALTFSSLMYGFALFATLGEFAGAPFPSEHQLFVPLVMIALMANAIAFILPKALFMKAGEKLKSAPTPADERAMFAAFFAPWIVRMAILESISIYGFVLAFISKSPVGFVPFGIMAVLGQLSQYPSQANIKKSLGLNAAT